MGKLLDGRLARIKEIVDGAVDAQGACEILKLLDGPTYPMEVLEELTLYSELLPFVREDPFSPHERYLQFIWDAFDKLPLSLFVPFSIPLRRLIAENLFKRCGAGFIAEENVRFNIGRNLEVGDFVFINRGVFLDTKGGVILGNQVALAEDVRIFTHGHSESSHMEREYKSVVIKDYAKIYAGAVILPGVIIGEQAIVGAHSLVTQDVPPNMLVAGAPARVIRERKTEGRSGDDLDHIWLF